MACDSSELPGLTDKPMYSQAHPRPNDLVVGPRYADCIHAYSFPVTTNIARTQRKRSADPAQLRNSTSPIALSATYPFDPLHMVPYRKLSNWNFLIQPRKPRGQ